MNVAFNIALNFRFLPTLPLERRVAPLGPKGRSRAGEGVDLWATDGPPPSIPPLKGEGGARSTAFGVTQGKRGS